MTWKKKSKYEWRASSYFCPKQNRKLVLYTQIPATCNQIRLENNFPWLVELWEIFIYFLRCPIFSPQPSHPTMIQSSLYKRKKQFLFWRTKGDSPAPPLPQAPPILVLTCGRRQVCLGSCSGLGSPLFHSPNAWLCYKPAANVPELEQRRCSNKCLLNWVILLCLDWARILLTDPLGFTITSTQWFSIRASNPSPRATGHYLETRLVIPGLGWEGVVQATGIWGV